MDTTTSSLLTGVIVVSGQVANGKGVNMSVVIAVLFLAMVLSIMGDANSDLARKFGLLILIVALFANGPAILKGLNIGGSKKK